MMNRIHMPKPKNPTAKEREAALLICRADPDYIRSCVTEKDKSPKPVPTIPDSETLLLELNARPKDLRRLEPGAQNLGPNPLGHKPQPFGILDFQDIALFLWPPYRQHSGFDLEEQCLILKHRNSRLRDITEEDLVEIQEWMDTSQIITVEENSVNMRDWRLWLSKEELGSLALRMEQDLKRARSVLNHMRVEEIGRNSVSKNRKRKLAALRIIQDEED